MPSLALAPGTACASCPFMTTSMCRVLGGGAPERLERKRRREMSLKPKRLLMREGEASNEVFRLTSGWGVRFKILANGERQILSFDLPGDFLTPELLCGEPARFSKMALTSMTLCALPAEETAQEVFGDPDKAKFIGSLLVRYIREADDRIKMLGRLSAAGRIAGLALHLHGRLSRRGMTSGNAFDFPLRHEDIGDALGLTAEHVSRTLAPLRKAGLLDIHGGRATIDHDELRKLAS